MFWLPSQFDIITAGSAVTMCLSRRLQRNLRVQLHSQDAVRTQVSAFPGIPNVGLGGINAIGAISNCPIIVVFPGGVTFSGGVQ